MPGPRVLLVHTNCEHAPYPVIPRGLCMVAASLEAAGGTPRLLDLCFARDPDQELRRALREWPPDVIGLSVRNLDNGDARRPLVYLPAIVCSVDLCRRESTAPVVLGGPAVSILPRRMLEETGADYAVVGDGEEAFPALVEALAAGRPAAGIAGVCASHGTEPVAPARVADLDALPAPRPERWLDLPRYLRRGSAFPLQTRRGCEFACTYCTYRNIEGSTYRLRAPEAVAAEAAETVARVGVRCFELVDSTLNRPAEHTAAVCDALLRKGVRARFQATDFNPGGVTRELLALMRRAGFTSLVCTPEAGSDRMLASLRKGFTADQVRVTARWAHEVGLPVLWMFMLGGPGECEETVRETRVLLEEVMGEHDRAVCTIGVRVFPDTELARTAVAEGSLSPDADLLRPTFYCSPDVTPRRIL